MTKLEFAQAFGRFGHDSIGQLRKYTKLPYWTHTEAVKDIVFSVTPTEFRLISAVLHDLPEDVAPINSAFGLPVIKGIFGQIVYEVVKDLTDVFTKEAFPYLNREERHSLERKRQAKMSDEAKLIKIADLIHNTSDITENDEKFAITYLKEKSLLLPLLKVDHHAANLILWNRANEQLKDLCKRFDINTVN